MILDGVANTLWLETCGTRKPGGAVHLTVASYPEPIEVDDNYTYYACRPKQGYRLRNLRRILGAVIKPQELQKVQITINTILPQQINKVGLKVALIRATERLILEHCYNYGYSPRSVNLAFVDKTLGKRFPLFLQSLWVVKRMDFYSWLPWWICNINAGDYARGWSHVYSRYGSVRLPELTLEHQRALILNGPNADIHRLEFLDIPYYHVNLIESKDWQSVLRAYYFLDPPYWWNQFFPFYPYLPRNATAQRLPQVLESARRQIFNRCKIVNLCLNSFVDSLIISKKERLKLKAFLGI